MKNWKSTVLIALLLLSLLVGNFVLLKKINRDLRAESEANIEEARAFAMEAEGLRIVADHELFKCRQNMDCETVVRQACCLDCYERMVILGRRIAEGELCNEGSE